MHNEEIPVIQPYNPLDKKNLGESAAKAMLASEVLKLPPDKFIGAGVYAIYYKGDYAPYSKISEMNQDGFNQPIYVGKAIPAGARKGGLGLAVEQGTSLYDRLYEHFESVTSAVNLNAEDFFCRVLVMDDIWIPLTESLLIEQFKPLWNCCIDGFGNHDPGKGRSNQQRSPWDTIHSGREWAVKLRLNANSAAHFLEKIDQYIKNSY